MTYERLTNILADIKTALEDAAPFLADDDITGFCAWTTQIKHLIDWGRNAKLTTTVAPDTLVREMCLIFDNERGNSTPPDWNPTNNQYMTYA